MNNFLEKTQEIASFFNMKIDEVTEREIDEYNYQMQVVVALSSSK